MSDASGGWRDRQGLTRPERIKEARILRLRERFARITRLYEFAVARRKLGHGVVLPLCVGLTGGVVLFFLIFGMR
jgi:hypothetical protein